MTPDHAARTALAFDSDCAIQSAASANSPSNAHPARPSPALLTQLWFWKYVLLPPRGLLQVDGGCRVHDGRLVGQFVADERPLLGGELVEEPVVGQATPASACPATRSCFVPVVFTAFRRPPTLDGALSQEPLSSHVDVSRLVA